MSVEEMGTGFPEAKQEQKGVFVTKELEGRTLYSSSVAKFEGALKPLIIKEVGYTHTTLGYTEGEGKENAYASGNQGKGAHLPEVITFEEAQRCATEYWEEKKKQNMADPALADTRIEEIRSALPTEIPKDPFELAKETHEKNLTRWKEQIRKIEPLILAAKKEILRALGSDAEKYSESTGYKVSEIIRNVTGADPERAGKKITKKILEAGINDIGIVENNTVRLSDIYFGKVKEYITLNKYQKLALEIASLLYFLERLPLQIMETELGGRLFGNVKEETIQGDKKRKAEWLAKRERLEKLLVEFQHVNVSENGVATPPYIKVVK